MTDKDPYRFTAALQDVVLGRLNAPLRDLGVALSQVTPGTTVLDVGCGTGAQLERYVEAGCAAAGVDASPAMVARARRRLGDRADVRCDDARHLPFPDGTFEVVSATLMLHELPPADRDAVMDEMARVLAPGGRILVTEFNAGPERRIKGRAMRALSLVAETAARHLRRGRTFLREGGVPRLAERHALTVERRKLVAGGNLEIDVLVRAPERL